MKTLAEMAVEVLTTADGRAKTAVSHAHAATWFAARAAGQPLPIGKASPPPFPARPERPELLPPREVPRRRPGSPAGRIALLHAVAHIELNAVDLHWDIIARFTDHPMPLGFYDDWVKAADEESRHFNSSATGLRRWAAITAPCPPMPACGARPKIRWMTCSVALPWCRWCLRRGGWM